MKRLFSRITIQKTFNFLFNKNKKQVEQQKTKPVELDTYCQSHLLRYRMIEANLTHGDRVIADINPVRVQEDLETGKMKMYFCPIDKIIKKQTLCHGDYGPLPNHATLHGLTVNEDIKFGLYNLRNVELYSNGTLQVIATADTFFEAI